MTRSKAPMTNTASADGVAAGSQLRTAALPLMRLGVGLRCGRPNLACRQMGRSFAAPSHSVVSISTSSVTISRVGAGSLEVGHLPVIDLGCLREIVQGRRRADPTTPYTTISISRRAISSGACLPGRFRGRSVTRRVCSPMPLGITAGIAGGQRSDRPG